MLVLFKRFGRALGARLPYRWTEQGHNERLAAPAGTQRIGGNVWPRWASSGGARGWGKADDNDRITGPAPGRRPQGLDEQIHNETTDASSRGRR